MRLFSTILIISLSLAVSLSSSAETLTAKAGTLQRQIDALEGTGVSTLAIEGEATAMDLVSLGSLPTTVETLDISGLKILPSVVTDAFMGIREFKEGEMPPYMLFGTHVKRILLPPGLRAIGEGAFAGLPIEELDLPSGLNRIGPYAFYGCGALRRVEMSSTSVDTLPEMCFYGCESLTILGLPAGIYTVGRKALSGCRVEELNLPSLREAGDYAFAKMPELRSITLSSKARLGEGCLFGNGLLEKISGTLLSDRDLVAGQSAARDILGRIGGEMIGEGAYAGISADSVVFASGIQKVCENAFRDAGGLRKVVASACGSMVPEYEPGAFYGCDTSGIDLYVEIGTEELWRSAEGWKEFNIIGRESGVDDIPATAGGAVRISLRNGILALTSSATIENVEVYSTDGMMLYSARPGATEYRDRISGLGQIAVVRVVSGGTMTVRSIQTIGE